MTPSHLYGEDFSWSLRPENTSTACGLLMQLRPNALYIPTVRTTDYWGADFIAHEQGYRDIPWQVKYRRRPPAEKPELVVELWQDKQPCAILRDEPLPVRRWLTVWPNEQLGLYTDMARVQTFVREYSEGFYPKKSQTTWADGSTHTTEFVVLPMDLLQVFCGTDAVRAVTICSTTDYGVRYLNLTPGTPNRAYGESNGRYK